MNHRDDPHGHLTFTTHGSDKELLTLGREEEIVLGRYEGSAPMDDTSKRHGIPTSRSWIALLAFTVLGTVLLCQPHLRACVLGVTVKTSSEHLPVPWLQRFVASADGNNTNPLLNGRDVEDIFA
jgi:hypothetical protein